MPPTPENVAIIGQVYEVSAYSSTLAKNPSPINISPAARLILSYDPNNLPQNATEVVIATYDTDSGWQSLEPVPGAVAEVGKAHAVVSHFSLFAVLAKTAEPAPAKFEVSNLTVEPFQVQIGQEVTISLNVANTGEKSGDYSLELKLDGAVESSIQVTVAAGASQIVNFTIDGDTAGKHQVEVAGLMSEFEVVKAAEPFKINWWLIGSIIGIVFVLAIWSILGWTWYKERRKNVKPPAKHPSKPKPKNEPRR